MLLLGGVLLIDGRDRRDVLLCVLSLGVAGTAVARWTTGEAPAPPLPAVAGLLGRVR